MHLSLIKSSVLLALAASVQTGWRPAGEISGKVTLLVMVVDQTHPNVDVMLIVDEVPPARLLGSAIHVGAEGQIGPPIFEIGSSRDWEPFGQGSRRVIQNAAFPPQHLTALLADGCYINVRTVEHPNGEIRGQITAPEAVDQQQHSVSVAAGYSTIANPFYGGSNTLNEVMPSVAPDTQLYKFNPFRKDYDSDQFIDGLGWAMNLTFAPGEGAWLYSPVDQTIVFAGEERAPLPAPRPPPGWYLLSARTPIGHHIRRSTRLPAPSRGPIASLRRHLQGPSHTARAGVQ